MKTYSDDPGPGEYGMSNHDVAADAREAPRNAMAPAFGKPGFQLEIDEIGMAPYDPAWHIIKRVK